MALKVNLNGRSNKKKINMKINNRRSVANNYEIKLLCKQY